MNLFTVPKIPVYCEGITHRLETRKSGETKVVDLTLKVQPFTGQIASALDPSEYGFVKRVLFKMDSGDPTVDLRAAEFTPPGDRQRLTCFATADSVEPSIVLDQVKVTKLRARRGKEAHGWTLYIGVSFGPLDRNELEYVNRFYTTQGFLTFEEAEPSLDFQEDGDDEADDAATPLRPAPMWDDDHPAAAAGSDEDSLQHLSSALLGKQCFLDVEHLRTLSMAEREGLAKWATVKGGPVWPPVLAKSHIVGPPNDDGQRLCSKCWQDFPVDDGVTYAKKSIIGLDCAGVDLEDARPIAKRGSKRTKKVDP
jgi:hypothetical protein